MLTGMRSHLLCQSCTALSPLRSPRPADPELLSTPISSRSPQLHLFQKVPEQASHSTQPCQRGFVTYWCAVTVPPCLLTADSSLLLPLNNALPSAGTTACPFFTC